jgi:hypothetical protein
MQQHMQQAVAAVLWFCFISIELMEDENGCQGGERQGFQKRK